MLENRPISHLKEMARTFLFWRLDGIAFRIKGPL